MIKVNDDLLILTVSILVLVGAPLLLIWCVNTLLGVTIPYTVKYWFAALMILMLFNSSKSTTK